MGKRYETGGERMQELRNLEYRDYLFHISNREKARKTLETVRTCFTYQNTYYVLETHVNVPGQPTILRTQSCMSKTTLPPFIDVIREVTGDNDKSRWSLAQLARPNFFERMMQGQVSTV